MGGGGVGGGGGVEGAGGFRMPVGRLIFDLFLHCFFYINICLMKILSYLKRVIFWITSYLLTRYIFDGAFARPPSLVLKKAFQAKQEFGQFRTCRGLDKKPTPQHDHFVNSTWDGSNLCPYEPKPPTPPLAPSNPLWPPLTPSGPL